MSSIQMVALSSLEKVFLNQQPEEKPFSLEAFKNETISYQIAYTLCDSAITRMYIALEIVSPISGSVHIRQVEHVPVRYPAPVDSDSNYLSKEPGLYPDLLREIKEHSLRARFGQWDSLWIDIEASSVLEPGSYPVTLRLTGEDGSVAENTQHVIVLGASLPPQKLIHTKWLHCDCLAQYYRQDVFSEEHWATIERFIRKAVSGGINMILTPIHTPPLDTRVGHERLTTQLVDVFVEDDTYSFDMTKLRRWIRMCRKCGVAYFEMAHLYTQWGAYHAPKIMAMKNGEYKRIFGWETDATSSDYQSFLYAYIPALRAVLKEEGVEKQTIWHISDEPSAAQLDNYRAAKEQIMPLLNDCIVMDALSNFDFYQKGVVAHPIIATNHIHQFIDEKVDGLWAYYCCAQYKDVSNTFIAMPSARNRILAVQLFKYRIQGFLQWGFNFYSSQYSDHAVNPYLVTDGDGFVPSGDTFQVYPGENGQPEESLRMAVTREAMQDLRAFEWLAELEGREFVNQLIEEGVAEELTFMNFPKDNEYLQNLRSRVNQAIMNHLAAIERK